MADSTLATTTDTLTIRPPEALALAALAANETADFLRWYARQGVRA